MQILAWYNLIFIIPFAVGILFMLSTALGVIDDVPDDINVIDSDGETSDVFSLLGFGRCPLVITIGTASIVFGGMGIITNKTFLSLIVDTPALAVGSIFVAIATSFFMTMLVTHVVAKYMPTLETTPLQMQDLSGASGMLLLDTDADDGLALFTTSGDVFQIRAVSDDGKLLQKGTKVILVEFDEQNNRGIVCRDPSVYDSSA